MLCLLSYSGDVSDAVSAALHVGLIDTGDEGLGGGGGGGMSSAGPAWRPRGVLLSHLAEHRKAVNGLAVAAWGAVVVSASDDETVKVGGWVGGWVGGGGG